MKKQRVVVAMSGGVDSAVAAGLLALTDLVEGLFDDVHERHGEELQVAAPARRRIEVDRAVVDDARALREIIESPEFLNSPSKLTLAMGRDLHGRIRVTDLAAM